MKLFNRIKKAVTSSKAYGKRLSRGEPHTNHGIGLTEYISPGRIQSYIQSGVIKQEQITTSTGGKKSSMISKTASLMGGLATNGGFREQPPIHFDKRFEYYMTVGKIQNVIDSMKDDITNRAWFFKDTTDGGKGGAYSGELKTMEDWADKTVQVSELLSEMIYNWTIAGTYIVSPIDWMPLQLRSLRSKLRDNFGNTVFYIQVINGKEVFLNAAEYMEVPFINLDRAARGVGLYDSIMNNQYLDVDGQQPNASIEMYRQTLQDQGRILHKFSNPLTFYMPAEGENVGQETIDNDIVPLIEGAKAGDRIAINKRIEIVKEDIDGKSRFTEYADDIHEEVDAGLQSSKNRLLTDPSAMADAREAGNQDDDRILGIMEKIRVFMNKSVIPAVLGIEAGIIEWQWGEKDSFHKIMPPHLKEALEMGVMQPEEVRQALVEHHDWNFPELDQNNQKMLDDRMSINEPVELSTDDKKLNEEAVLRVRMEKAEIEKRTLLLSQVEEQLEELK
jgi:hypothetical protein